MHGVLRVCLPFLPPWGKNSFPKLRRPPGSRRRRNRGVGRAQHWARLARREADFLRRLFWKHRQRFSQLLAVLNNLRKPPQTKFHCGRQTARAA